MVIVNSKEKWSHLQKRMKTQHFVYLQMFSDVHKHPKQNRVSCFYIRTMQEEYIVPVNHNEKFGTIQTIDVDDSKVCVGDMKSFMHNSMIDIIICMRCYYKYKHNIDLLAKNNNIKELYSSL